MNRNPKVSILMPVFGAEPYLHASVDSILAQTLGDFELLIISEHGTSDANLAEIESLSDERVRHIHNKRLLGITKSLNVGLKEARGEYIARMDADDLSLPKRLEKQVKSLDAKPEIGVIGSSFETIDEKGRIVSRQRPPVGPTLTKWLLLFGNVIAHPSVMVRRTVYELLSGYKDEFLYAEDYDFWVRAAMITQITNLPDVLLKLRIHDEQLSSIHRKIQLENASRVSRNAVTAVLSRDISPRVVYSLAHPYSVSDAQEAVETSFVLYDLYLRSVNQKAASKEETTLIRRDAAYRFYRLARACTRRNPIASALISCLTIRLFPTAPIWFAMSKIRKLVR